MDLLVVVAALLGILAPAAAGQERPREAEKVGVCTLLANRAAYNQKLIEVTGVVSHGFERFVFSDPACAERLGIWLEYGGTVGSGTVYCCGISADRTRETPLVVEGIGVPLSQDATFRRFDARIRTGEEANFRATVVGRFFAGHPQRVGAGKIWGYGHLGCCSLLVIQQVVTVDSVDGEARRVTPAAGALRTGSQAG
jgi:hypothetical protein